MCVNFVKNTYTQYMKTFYQAVEVRKNWTAIYLYALGKILRGLEYINTLHSFYYFNINSFVCQGKLYNLTLFHNKLTICMWKKTVDKREKRCYSRCIIEYFKMPIRKAFYKKGFSESPAAASAVRCERGIPEYKAHRLWVRPIHGGSSRYRASTRYTLCNFFTIITLGIWIWVETRYCRPLVRLD